MEEHQLIIREDTFSTWVAEEVFTALERNRSITAPSPLFPGESLMTGNSSGLLFLCGSRYTRLSGVFRFAFRRGTSLLASWQSVRLTVASWASGNNICARVFALVVWFSFVLRLEILNLRRRQIIVDGVSVAFTRYLIPNVHSIWLSANVKRVTYQRELRPLTLLIRIFLSVFLT